MWNLFSSSAISLLVLDQTPIIKASRSRDLEFFHFNELKVSLLSINGIKGWGATHHVILIIGGKGAKQ